MSTIELLSIPSERFFAREMQAERRDALLRGGMSADEASAIVDPENQEHVDAQIDLMNGIEKCQKERVGAFVLKRSEPLLLLGFYELSEVKKFSFGTYFGNRPETILSLSANHRQKVADPDFILSLLIEDALRKIDEGHRKVKTSHYENDPAIPHLIAHDFKSLEVEEQPDTAIPQGLMVRYPHFRQDYVDILPGYDRDSTS